MVYLISDDPSDWADVMITTILTCDSSLEAKDASDIARNALLSVVSGEPYRKNGIGYAFSPVDDSYLFVASLLDE